MWHLEKKESKFTVGPQTLPETSDGSLCFQFCQLGPQTLTFVTSHCKFPIIDNMLSPIVICMACLVGSIYFLVNLDLMCF